MLVVQAFSLALPIAEQQAAAASPWPVFAKDFYTGAQDSLAINQVLFLPEHFLLNVSSPLLTSFYPILIA